MSVMNFIENISPFMKLTNYFREGGEVCDCIKTVSYTHLTLPTKA